MHFIKCFLYEIQPIRIKDLFYYGRTLKRGLNIMLASGLDYLEISFKIILDSVLKTKASSWVLMCTWLMIWAGFLYFDFGSLWIIVSMIGGIFLNLGERKSGDMSAYSVFNAGFKQLLGTLNAEQFDCEIRHGESNINAEDFILLDDVLLEQNFVDDLVQHFNDENGTLNENGTDEGEGAANGVGIPKRKGKKGRRTYEQRLQRRRQQQRVDQLIDDETEFQ